METDSSMNNFWMKLIPHGKWIAFPRQTSPSIGAAVANTLVSGRKKEIRNSHRPGSQTFTGPTVAFAKQRHKHLKI